MHGETNGMQNLFFFFFGCMSRFKAAFFFYNEYLHLRHFQEKPFIIYEDSGCLRVYKKLCLRKTFELCPRR